MKIALIPQRRDENLVVVKNGDILTINGEVFDFSSLKDGQCLPRSAMHSNWFVGDVTRLNGELQLTLIAPHGPNPTQTQAFPEPLVNVQDGEVIFP